MTQWYLKPRPRTLLTSDISAEGADCGERVLSRGHCKSVVIHRRTSILQRFYIVRLVPCGPCPFERSAAEPYMLSDVRADDSQRCVSTTRQSQTLHRHACEQHAVSALFCHQRVLLRDGPSTMCARRTYYHTTARFGRVGLSVAP